MEIEAAFDTRHRLRQPGDPRTTAPPAYDSAVISDPSNANRHEGQQLGCGMLATPNDQLLSQFAPVPTYDWQPDMMETIQDATDSVDDEYGEPDPSYCYMCQAVSFECSAQIENINATVARLIRIVAPQEMYKYVQLIYNTTVRHFTQKNWCMASIIAHYESHDTTYGIDVLYRQTIEAKNFVFRKLTSGQDVPGTDQRKIDHGNLKAFQTLSTMLLDVASKLPDHSK